LQLVPWQNKVTLLATYPFANKKPAELTCFS
jgi:hypothetical protein